MGQRVLLEKVVNPKYIVSLFNKMGLKVKVKEFMWNDNWLEQQSLCTHRCPLLPQKLWNWWKIIWTSAQNKNEKCTPAKDNRLLKAVKYFHCTGCGQYYKYTTEVTTLSLVALNVRKAFNVQCFGIYHFSEFDHLHTSKTSILLKHLFFNF